MGLLKEAWTLAIETLSWVQMRRLSEPLAFARTVKQLGVSDLDSMRLAHMLVSETVRRQNFIDKFINNTIKPATIDEYRLGVQAFLRLYVYQTRMAKDWADANIEEAEKIVELARRILGWKALLEVEPFLGMLLTQEPETVLEGASDEKQVGLKTYHPTWFVKYCFRLFGRTQSLAMLEADMHPPPTYLRLNTLKDGEKQILERLAEEEVKLEKVEQLRFTYKVAEAKKPITRTASFKEGLFYVQDRASCFTAEAANPASGMNVLDVCSAPGAKTTHLAQLMQNRGNIFSVDYSKRRMKVWKSEITHMGAEIAQPIIADARIPLPFTEDADVLVLDPPCTSTGDFAKLPSAKWRLTPKSIDRMAEIQRQMLDSCAGHVKPGGTLIYSTCSITVEENEMQIERFLKWHADFALAEVSPKIGLPGLRGLEKCQRLYPHTHLCNGFFIAKLSKSSCS
jgi:16S rRNA (cytosine967-C5)-methyltransferase